MKEHGPNTHDASQVHLGDRRVLVRAGSLSDSEQGLGRRRGPRKPRDLALARDLGDPLLFKGDDLKLTEIEIVIQPIKAKRLSEVVASYGSA